MPGDVVCTTVAMLHSGRALFIGTSIGTVRVIRYPLPIQKDWLEYQAHSGPITKVMVTFLTWVSFLCLQMYWCCHLSIDGHHIRWPVPSDCLRRWVSLYLEDYWQGGTRVKERQGISVCWRDPHHQVRPWRKGDMFKLSCYSVEWLFYTSFYVYTITQKILFTNIELKS